MADISDFKVYVTEPYFRIGRIYCVITGEKNEKTSDIITEWHYYMKDKKKKMISQRILVKGFDSVENVWKYLTIENLESVLYHEEIYPVFEEIKDFSLFKKVGLEELKKEALIYLSAENFEFIEYLRTHTCCNELKKLVNVLPIIKVIKQNIEE